MPLLAGLPSVLFGTRTQPLPGRLGGDLYLPSRHPVQTHDEADGARQCAAPGCTGVLRRRWKSRRPVFEDGWACGSRCLQTLVRAAVRRELGGRRPAGPAYRHRVPLGLVLLEQGWITHAQLLCALEAQRAAGHGRIGYWLGETCGLEEQYVTRGVALQWGCPVLSAEGLSAEAMALVMPRSLLERSSTLPLRVAGGKLLYLAAETERDAAAELMLETMCGLRVETGLLAPGALADARERLLRCAAVPERRIEVADGDELVRRIAGVIDEAQPVAARLAGAGEGYWLRLWLERGASGTAGAIPATAEDIQDALFFVRETGRG